MIKYITKLIHSLPHTHDSHTNISATPTIIIMNRKTNLIAASYNGTAKLLKMVHIAPKRFC